MFSQELDSFDIIIFIHRNIPEHPVKRAARSPPPKHARIRVLKSAETAVKFDDPSHEISFQKNYSSEISLDFFNFRQLITWLVQPVANKIWQVQILLVANSLSSICVFPNDFERFGFGRNLNLDREADKLEFLLKAKLVKKTPDG